METAHEPGISSTQTASSSALLAQHNYDTIKKYYDVAGPDYESWSRNFNMHFGFCRSFTDIFFLERMLVNMNAEVINRLQIDPAKTARIADLGCGVGTAGRYTAKRFPLSTITCVTISDYQVEKGRSLVEQDKLEGSVFVMKNNFEDLDFEDGTFSHAYALESACHSNGSGKELFIAEMARVLQSGGRFCIADGFLKHDKKLPRFFNYLYKKIIKYWALPCFGNIHEFEANLTKYGLTNIKTKEISLRIAPSVAYVPWTCVKFFVKEIWRNRSLRMKKERWYNVYGPVLGMILGLYRKHFGYYIISGEKA